MQFVFKSNNRSYHKLTPIACIDDSYRLIKNMTFWEWIPKKSYICSVKLYDTTKTFTDAYPNTDFQVITPENIAEFLGDSSSSH